jgi:hypothetical protein
MTDEEKKQKSRERTRKWALENKERIKQYREINKEKIKNHKREYDRIHYSENSERFKGKVKKYRNENPEYMIKYRDCNNDKIQSRRRDYYSENLNHCVYCFELPDSRMYIGSTSHIGWRLSAHKQDLKKKDLKLYQAIRESGGWDSVKVHVLMHDIPDYQLRLKMEQHYLDMVPEQLSLNTLNVIQKVS